MKNVKHRPNSNDVRSATHIGFRRHDRNPPGTKVANRMLKAAGVPKYRRSPHVFHGTELTAAAKARSAKRAPGSYTIVMHSDYGRSLREDLERQEAP